MASQSTQSIPFTFTAPLQTFRLLELPPEILQLLRSSNPPTLKLKSNTSLTETPSSKSAGSSSNQATTTAHLVTSSRTYQIRQVSTSNSVFITQSADPVATQDDTDVDLGFSQTSTSLTAVSQVDSILELLPVSYSAAEELRRALPAWSNSDPNPDQFGPRRTKRQVFSEIPIPDLELELAYLDLLGVSLQQGSAAVRPTANAALAAWKDILTTALEQSIDLSSFFFPSNLLGNSSDSNSSEDFGALREAVLRYLTHVTNADAEVSTSSDPLAKITAWNPDEKLWIPKDKLILWTGSILLESLHDQAKDDPFSQASSIPTSDFLTQWRDLLPESWRDGADLAVLSHISAIDNGSVRWSRGAGSAASTGAVIEGNSKSGAAGGAADKKRKWHEKFKAERDARVAAAKK